eukprot:TRINITY_DN1114_c0_g1_i2.p1 TRINITY_DN1114_c0_g1~~TRINITY_DN1114_c0_g1_i2.p1  ORF type:complete len:802 (+),score=195.80 TRINITY_DN1114_c0_g1_i2:293-2407(+)
MSSMREVVSSVELHFEQPEKVVQAMSDMMQTEAVTVARMNELLAVYRGMLRGIGVTSSCWVTTKEGGLFGVYSQLGITGMWWWNASDSMQHDYQTDEEGNVVQELSAYVANNTESSWYVLINATEESFCWTDPLVYNGESMITFSHSAFQGDTFIGATGSDLFLTYLSTIMQALRDTEDKNLKRTALIVDKDENVWAFSDPDVAVTVTSENGDQQPIKFQKFANDNDLTAVYNYIRKHYGSSVQAGRAQMREWVTTDELLLVSNLERPCLEWAIVVLMQPSYVKVNWVFIVISCAITAVIIAFAVVFTMLQISRPLRKISRAMNAIITDVRHASSMTTSGSRVSEINGISEAFGKLGMGIDAMTKYVPSALVGQILASNSTQLLGMHPAKLTIMFTDIQNFSGISEHNSKAVVADLLCRWFASFSDVILDSGGSIDKYIGDCIMAVWGAPEPVENTELRACGAALEFNRALETLNAGLPKGYPSINCRVGIHYGELLVGNIGYQKRMNYTVCGNACNIAARLEQAGKEYKVTPLISGEVVKAISKQYLCVWLDAVVLHGYTRRVTQVFHLVTTKASATPAQLNAARTFRAIRRALHARNFDKANDLVAACENDPEFEQYAAVLLILEEHCIQESFMVRSSSAGKVGANVRSPSGNLSEGQATTRSSLSRSSRNTQSTNHTDEDWAFDEEDSDGDRDDAVAPVIA